MTNYTKEEDIERIFARRTKYKDHPTNCTKCKHYEKEKGAVGSYDWGQCKFNGEVKGAPCYEQIVHAPMITNEDTCEHFDAAVTPCK